MDLDDDVRTMQPDPRNASAFDRSKSGHNKKKIKLAASDFHNLANCASDPKTLACNQTLHVWLQARIFGVGGSNDVISGLIISKMAADGHLGMTALSRVTLASAGLSCLLQTGRHCCRSNNSVEVLQLKPLLEL